MEVTNKGSFWSTMKTIYMIILCLAVISSFSAATFAWFSISAVTKTTMVKGRVQEADVKLALSTGSGASFQGRTEADPVTVNGSAKDFLLPVSTATLERFIYCQGSTVETAPDPDDPDNEIYSYQATDFILLESEKFFYHGRLFIKAEAVNQPENAKLLLYLDENEDNGGLFLSSQKGYLKNAARVGLKFADKEPIILSLSDENNPNNHDSGNIFINGEKLPQGKVLDYDAANHKIVAANDPAESYVKYLCKDDVTDPNMKPLMEMELNKEYTLDIYFYLEGCDPDCTSIQELDKLDFHLGFYGVLSE